MRWFSRKEKYIEDPCPVHGNKPPQWSSSSRDPQFFEEGCICRNSYTEVKTKEE